MIEKQFAEFLTAQIRAKFQMLSHDIGGHSAVAELNEYVDQLDSVFAFILAQDRWSKPRKKRTDGSVRNITEYSVHVSIS